MGETPERVNAFTHSGIRNGSCGWSNLGWPLACLHRCRQGTNYLVELLEAHSGLIVMEAESVRKVKG